MSDPAKSAREIEDVLSSIRRLVTETSSNAATARAVDPAPENETMPDASAEIPVPESGEKLVLTQALRVTDPDDPWAPVPVQPATAPSEPEVADRAAKRDDESAWAMEDRLADWGEIEESAQEAIADALAGSDDAGASGDARHEERDPIADLGNLVGFDVFNEEKPADFEPETGDADWPDGMADRTLRDLAAARGQSEAGQGEKAFTETQEQPVAEEELEAAPPVDQAGPKAEVSAEAVQDDLDALSETERAKEEALERELKAISDAQHTADAQDEAVDRTAEAPDRTETGEAADTPDTFTPVFSRRMARRKQEEAADAVVEPEAETTGTPDLSEETPAEDGPEDPAPEDVMAPDATTMDESDATDEDATPENLAVDPEEDITSEEVIEALTQDAVEDLGDTPSPFSFPEAEDSILDEEALRELIAEVVREELQGVLGQRITRNVRKMVRREIRMALAAEGLG